MGLTRKQHICLSFVNERIRESGIAPSFLEMQTALDIKSKSGVHRIVSALVERGFIRRMNKRARAIEIIRLPENMDRQRAPITREQARIGARPSHVHANSFDGAVTVPLVGRIAASTPIEALQNKIGDIAVSAGMIGKGGHYALEVIGDFMINAGILDGDTVIIQESGSANTGEIIVALVDHEEATLKRLRRRGDSIALEPANPAYETRLYIASRISIQGRLVGLIRRY